jgi:hypothetical protein
MTDWFRSWHGAPTDNKWLVIAKRAKTKPGIVSAVWWALLDHASQSIERGRVSDFDIETYANYSGFDETVVEAVLKAIGDKGLILNGILISWEKRQPSREDLTATDRKRKQREREVVTVTPPDDVTPCHAVSHTVTTEESRVEQIRVEEKEDDDDARKLLARICEILRVELKASPDRLTWHRQVQEMLRDGIGEPEIIQATEKARTRGKLSLAYIRAVALSPAQSPSTPPTPNGTGPPVDVVGERLKAKWAAEEKDGQAGRLRANS